MRRLSVFLLTSVFVFTLAVPLRADEITDWNQNLLKAVHTSGASPLAISRFGAIVQAAVYDAVNGIERRYTPIHVEPNAPRGASIRAAAVQAAYETLVKLFPAQKPDLDAKRAASLEAISSDSAAEDSVAIARGIEWGKDVADAILLWRSTDGAATVLPPYLGGTAPGQWRPTPPAGAPGAGLQFASMTPWVIAAPNQFRPAGPPALGSSPYAADYLETKLMGQDSSVTRTTEQTLYSNFWASTNGAWFWDRVAVSLAGEKHLNLSETSRLLAVVNVAMADAGIGCFEAKYFYSFWRPVTAIRLGDTDGNVATIGDPAWTPLVVTPPFPEYPSAHSCLSSAASGVLSDYFGENTAIVVDSDSATMVGVTRSFPSFSLALDEIKNARIFGGIHFRTATDDGGTLGAAVADYVLDHAFLPVHGEKEGQIQH